MARIPGFRALGGTSRRYVNLETGEIVSRRQAEQQHGRGTLRPGQTFEQQARERAQAQGRITTTSAGRVVHAPANPQYRSLLEGFRAQHGGKRGQARVDPRFREVLKALNELKHAEQKAERARSPRWRSYWSNKVRELRKPNGRVARALAQVGRKRDDEYTVGETPT